MQSPLRLFLQQSRGNLRCCRCTQWLQHGFTRSSLHRTMNWPLKLSLSIKNCSYDRAASRKTFAKLSSSINFNDKVTALVKSESNRLVHIFTPAGELSKLIEYDFFYSVPEHKLVPAPYHKVGSALYPHFMPAKLTIMQKSYYVFIFNFWLDSADSLED